MKQTSKNLPRLWMIFRAQFRGKLGDMTADDYVTAYEMTEQIYDLRGRLEFVRKFEFFNRYIQYRLSRNLSHGCKTCRLTT